MSRVPGEVSCLESCPGTHSASFRTAHVSWDTSRGIQNFVLGHPAISWDTLRRVSWDTRPPVPGQLDCRRDACCASVGRASPSEAENRSRAQRRSADLPAPLDTARESSRPDARRPGAPPPPRLYCWPCRWAAAVLLVSDRRLSPAPLPSAAHHEPPASPATRWPPPRTNSGCSQ